MKHVYLSTGQSVYGAHSEQDVVVHACHGHKYQPSPVPLSGTGRYKGVRAVQPESVADRGLSTN